MQAVAMRAFREPEDNFAFFVPREPHATRLARSERAAGDRGAVCEWSEAIVVTPGVYGACAGRGGVE